MSDIPPLLSESPAAAAPAPAAALRSGKKAKGFFPRSIVRTVAFYIISLCIVASVIVCILAIWDFAKRDSLWRMIASFVVVAAGTALFAVVNDLFGDDKNA